jgi:hypothetical protein
MMTGYRLGDWGSIPDKGREFFLYRLHPASCTMGTGGEVQPGHDDADYSLLFSAEVKKERDCTSSSLKYLSWHVAGQCYLYILCVCFTMNINHISIAKDHMI